MKAWYVVYTHMNAEAKVAYNLARQGLTVYLPQYGKIRRHARRQDLIRAPLFPRYIFVELDLEADRWHSVNSTYGAIRLVSNGDFPAILPDRFVDNMRASEDDQGFIKLNDWSRVEPGERIRIVDGLFRDQIGIFEGQSDTDRVRVLLDILGRTVSVKIAGNSAVVQSE